MGAAAYRILEEHSDVGPDECVVEIGSERGEGSTAWISEFCSERGVTFYTVDMDPLVHRKAKALVNGYETCRAVHAFGEDFLRVINKKIRFAYLDAFDCIPQGFENADFIHSQRERYTKMGLGFGNRASARSHLALAQLVEAHAASRCTVLIDDTSLEESRWKGKGSSAMPYLRKRGFAVSDLGGAGLATR